MGNRLQFGNGVGWGECSQPLSSNPVCRLNKLAWNHCFHSHWPKAGGALLVKLLKLQQFKHFFSPCFCRVYSFSNWPWTHELIFGKKTKPKNTFAFKAEAGFCLTQGTTWIGSTDLGGLLAGQVTKHFAPTLCPSVTLGKLTSSTQGQENSFIAFEKSTNVWPGLENSGNNPTMKQGLHGAYAFLKLVMWNNPLLNFHDIFRERIWIFSNF